MRIAQIAPLIRSVPPDGYGGAEEVVSLLTEELVRRGHAVTLYASGDSATCAALEPIVPVNLVKAGITEHGFSVEESNYDLISAATCFGLASSFDLIHNHVSPAAMMMAKFVNTPVLTTVHGGQHNSDPLLWSMYTGYYNTVSRALKLCLPDRRYLGHVYNGVDYATYPFSPHAGDYLLSLGRIGPDKGTDIAIEVAKRLGARLLVVGPVASHREFFEDEVKPEFDAELICYLGEANGAQKRQLFAGARCLLFPVRWEEPFGITMVEAMACGTPVIAFNRGAVPEVVVHGETGFIVGDIDDMVEAVRTVDTIDRRKCREHVERNFSASRMADEYLAIYERLLV